MSKEGKGVVAVALNRAGKAGETLADTIENILKKIRGGRNVVTTKLTDRDVEVIETMVKLDVFDSKSEAAAFFIHEGIRARNDLLEGLRPLIDKIRQLKEEAKQALKHPQTAETKEE